MILVAIVEKDPVAVKLPQKQVFTPCLAAYR
jgi:hypothetical protein